MNVLPLAKTFPEVSRLVYGCMGLGGGWKGEPVTPALIKQAEEVVQCALDIGINFFDHADIYTLGNAETVFGKVLEGSPSLREQMIIQSKCGIRFEDSAGPKRYDFSKEWVSESVNNILQRLKTEYLDILLLHRPDPLMDPEALVDSLHTLKAEGKIRHVGVSNMHTAQMAFLQSHLNMPILVNQVEISLQQRGWVDEGIYAGNPEGSDVNFTAGTLEYCRQQGVQLQSWGSLCQGVYSGRDVSDQDASVQSTAALVKELAGEYSVSREAIVLAWLMRHPAMVQPVIGTTNLERIKACAEANKVTLTREQWYSLYVSARGEELP